MYVDAHLIKKKLWIAERDHKGNRNVRETNPPYVFYYEDKDGFFKAIQDDNVKLKRKLHTKYYDMKDDVQKKRNQGIKCYETDVDPVLRYLEEKYPNDDDLPPLHVTFIDIEVSQVEDAAGNSMGYEGSRPNNPLGEINAVTLYNLWEKKAFTLALAPPGMTVAEARELLDETDNEDGHGALTEDDGYFICESEEELIEIFLELISDTDVLSGWNSEFYDLPYIINRIRVLLGHERPEAVAAETGDQVHPMDPSNESIPYLERLNLFPCLPTMRLKDQYGTQSQTYHLHGRVHLDYMLLFQKFTKNTIGELHSYALDYVLNEVVNQSKIKYTGSLDELRANRFRTFIAYNRQDTMGLAAIEEKLTIMDQANVMSHMAGVPLDKVLGSVVIIEQAILRRLHKQKRICFDKPKIENSDKIPGAFVLDPHEGKYDWVVSFDIASLYPSMIRLLNISPETMIGQFLTPETDKIIAKFMGNDPDLSTPAWAQVTGVVEYHDIIEEKDSEYTLQYAEGHLETRTGREWKQWLIDNNYAISANATVFDLNRKGIVAECIDDWFHSRIEWKKTAGKYQKKLGALLKEWKDKELTPEIKAEILELTKAAAKWDTKQMAGKIFMNSTYGAFLNRYFRFTDSRLGKSVTLSGRVVEKHTIKEASKKITGNYEFDRDAIIYGDTDSVYASLSTYLEKNNIDLSDFKKACKEIIGIADRMGEEINSTYFNFVKENFLVDDHRAKAVEAVRDVVAPRGLFKSVKKRYALWVIDSEGKPKDEIKIMGMETRRSDTPKVLQKFIETCIEKVLKEDLGYEDVYRYVQDYRKNEYRIVEPWKRGAPQRIKNLTGKSRELARYEEKMEKNQKADKPLVHYSLKAAMNTNKLIKYHEDMHWDQIRDGDKIEIIKLRRNEMGYDTVAIKVGEDHIPEWFKELPFDVKGMEEKMFDRKLSNTLGVILDWDFTAEDNYGDKVFIQEDFFESLRN